MWRPGRRDDVDLVADLEVVVVGGVLVDGDLVGARRGLPIEQANRAVGVGAVPRGAEHRCPAGGDGFAVRVDDLGGALELAVGVGDAGNGGDGVDEFGGHRVAGAWPSSLVLSPNASSVRDLQVGVLEGVGEQRVEAGAHAVGEHERADDERHAEDDGDGDGDQAADAGADAAARQEEGGVGTHRRLSRSASPGRARRPAVGASISSTMRPSLRNTTRSAYDAALGIVGDHHDRLAVLAHGPAHEVEDLGAGPRVEVAGRLVGEDDVGAGVEGPGDGDALLLAAGQLARAVAQTIGEPDRADHLAEPLLVGDPGRRAAAAG